MPLLTIHGSERGSRSECDGIGSLVLDGGDGGGGELLRLEILAGCL